MSYQKKYWYQFTGEDNKVNIVEIWQDSASVINAEEIRAMDEPFITDLEIERFQAVKSSSCTINLLSDTSRKFFDSLYHVDPKEIMIKHYIDNSLNWIGYLNSELYNETYSESKNYPTSMYGNDGFNMLERLKFVDELGNNYYGIKTEFELLTICLSRIGLPYTDLRVNLSTTFNGYSNSASNTIFHETYINTSNYINESGEPCNLKSVVESILKPYAAFIIQSNGSLYINDVNSVASNSTQNYRCYNTSNWSYTTTITESNNIITFNKSDYRGTGQSIEKSGGKNQQKVIYSPYAENLLVDKMISIVDEFSSVPETFSTKYGFNYRTLSGNQKYVESNGATFEESYYQAGDESQIYLRFPKNDNNVKVLTCNDNDYYVVSAGKFEKVNHLTRYVGVSLRLKGEAMLTTKDNPYDNSTAEEYYDFSLRVGLNIGDSGYYVTDCWLTNASWKHSTSNIANQFIDFEIIIPLGNGRRQTWDVNGVLKLDIFSKVITLSRNGIDETPDAMKEVWLKNLKVEFIDSITNAPITTKDVEYTSSKNDMYLDPADDVELICGTDSLRTDKGKIMKFDGIKYSSVLSWTRGGQTGKIEEILCNSLASNNKEGYITLSNMILKNNFNPINVLKDYLQPDKTFMVTGLSRNYYANESECKLTEIVQDGYTLVIENN